MTQFVYGCDPELFVMQNGVFKSGFGLIPGNKDRPYKVNKGAVQVDGMALELNIEPASSCDEFVGNLSQVMQQLKEMVPDFQVVATPVAEFDEGYLSTQPREALELGCDPDFNAWEDGEVNPSPNAAANFRTGAGHIHIGWTEDANILDPDHLQACIMLTRQLDCFVGLLSVLYDSNTKRRELYGKAGAFRPKTYGVEYRVLSNEWLTDERLTRVVYNSVDTAVKHLVDGVSYEASLSEGYYFASVTDVINDSMSDTALEMLDDLANRIPGLQEIIDEVRGIANV